MFSHIKPLKNDGFDLILWIFHVNTEKNMQCVSYHSCSHQFRLLADFIRRASLSPERVFRAFVEITTSTRCAEKKVVQENPNWIRLKKFSVSFGKQLNHVVRFGVVDKIKVSSSDLQKIY